MPLRPLLLSLGLLAAASCGDYGNTDADSRGVAVTVFLPSGPDAAPGSGFAASTASVEYKLSCESDAADGSADDGMPRVDGALSRTGEFESESKGQTSIWKGLVAFRQGPCVIELSVRDADGEYLCGWDEAVALSPESSDELHFESPCYTYGLFYGCTTTPLPDAERSPKVSCEALVGLVLSAETPADVEEIQTIRYVMSEDYSYMGEDPDWVERYSGSLSLAGTGMTDFGQGPVSTSTWDVAIEYVAAHSYLLDLIAFDADDEALCAVQTQVTIVPRAVAQIDVLMPCIIDGSGAQ